MKTSKKNSFLTFCFSLIPGMAHMYMGFFKIGLSLAGLFFAMIALTTLLGISQLAFVFVIVWAYSFFHAHNLASSSDEVFAGIEDDFLFGLDTFTQFKFNNEKYRKYFGIGLMVFGILLLWNITMDMVSPFVRDVLPDYFANMFWRIRNLVPQLIIGIFVIILGVRMIRGKGRSLPGKDTSLPGKCGGKSEVDDGK